MKFISLVLSTVIVCSNAMAKTTECRVEAGVDAVGHENYEEKHIIPYDPNQIYGRLKLEAKTPSEKHRIAIRVDFRDDSITIEAASDDIHTTYSTGVGEAKLQKHKENRRRNGKSDEVLLVACKIQ